MMCCCSDPHAPAADLDADPGDRGRWRYPDCDGLAVCVKIDGPDEASGITITVPADGWPPGWRVTGNHPGVRIGPFAMGVYRPYLPNTEAGRRAAWAMEGK